MKVAFDKIAISTGFILAIHEHGRSFHLLMSSVYLFNVLNSHWKSLLSLWLSEFQGVLFLKLLSRGCFLLISSTTSRKRLLIFTCLSCVLLLDQTYIRFLADSLGSFKYRNMLSANTDPLASSFPTCIPSIFLLCYCSKTENTLKKSEESWHPCLVSDFREIISRFSSI